MSKRVQILPGTSNTARHILAKNHMKLLSTTPRTIKAYLIYSFSWINMQTKTEDVHVTKLVVLVTRIPKHLELYFSNFSTNFLAFSKFSIETKGKGLKSCG